MKIGLLGGTFDPVHNGHLKLAAAALKQLRLDRVYFVLSPRSPFKLDHAQTPVSSRLTMLAAALRGRKRFSVGRWELKRRGPSYTYMTLESLRKRNPKQKLFLIMGSDVLRGFARWKNPAKVRRLATVVVGRRPGASAPTSKGIVTLRGVFPKISSTNVRALARRGKKFEPLVPAAVANVIRRKELYK